MALVVKDRVKETSITTGTGSYALAGAVTGFQAFSAVGNGNTCYYCATDGTDWEVGLGTWSTGGTLARTAIRASSNANAAVSWAAGTRTIFLVVDAQALAAALRANKVVETGNGPYTVADDTAILVLNRGTPGASSVVVGSVANRKGLELEIYDVAGNAGDITITPDGSETIMLGANWIVGSNADQKAGFKMKPDTDLSTWLVR